jgi:hypothetical protein
MANASTELPVVVQKAYEFSIWLIRKVENFPRSYRFSVGDRLVQGVLDLLLRLVDAAYSRDKFRILSVNGMLNRMRFLLPLVGRPILAAAGFQPAPCLRPAAMWETVWSCLLTCTKRRAARRWARGSPQCRRVSDERGERAGFAAARVEFGGYRTGPYREFRVDEAKPRLISAAPFRDRVVHHALTQVLERIFERRFSKDSYACRVGMGTHRALDRAKWAAARFPYVLKCDVRKYFASIDHQILKLLLEKRGEVSAHSHPLFSGRRPLFAFRAPARLAAWKSNLAIPGERLFESVRPVREPGIAACMLYPVRGRFPIVWRLQGEAG